MQGNYSVEWVPCGILHIIAKCGKTIQNSQKDILLKEQKLVKKHYSYHWAQEGTLSHQPRPQDFQNQSFFDPWKYKEKSKIKSTGH